MTFLYANFLPRSPGARSLLFSAPRSATVASERTSLFWATPFTGLIPAAEFKPARPTRSEAVSLLGLRPIFARALLAFLARRPPSQHCYSPSSRSLSSIMSFSQLCLAVRINRDPIGLRLPRSLLAAARLNHAAHNPTVSLAQLRRLALRTR